MSQPEPEQNHHYKKFSTMSQNNLNNRRLSNEQQLEIYVAQKEAEKQAKIAKQQELQQTIQNIQAHKAELLALTEKQGHDLTQPQEDDRDYSTPLHQYLQSTKTPRVYPEVEPEVIPPLFVPSQWQDWDCEQSVRMLRVLGFENGDRCYIRALPAKGMSEDERKKRYLSRGKDFYLEFDQSGELFIVPYEWQETTELKEDGTLKSIAVPNPKKATKNWGSVLVNLNLKGYGIYLVPNKGGRKNDEITHWQSIFFEVDDRSLDDQKAQTLDFAQKTGVKPTLRVRTKKGFHNYYRFIKSEWQLPGWTEEVAKPTVLAMQSDPSITNNARLMRLAGFYHVQMKKGTNEIEYQRCDIVECSPDAEYTRKEFKAALLKYSGREYSPIRLELLTYVNSPTHKDYQHRINKDLFPLNHQICECPDELIEELNARTRLYLRNLKDDELDPEEAWFKDVSHHIVKQRRISQYSNSGKWSNQTPGRVPDVVRWAKYLYGYNQNGRSGWITAQDPLIPESEQANHSIDSLHINVITGAFKSHRGSDSKDIYAAMREIAKKANPLEFVQNDVAAVDFIDLDAPLPELRPEDIGIVFDSFCDKVLTKEEFEAKHKKVKPTEQEEQEEIIAQAMAAEQKAAEINNKLDQFFKKYAINRKQVAKYYECSERYLSDTTFEQFPTIEQCQQRGQLLGLKAPKGTGKSYRIKQYIQQAKKAGWLVVSVTPRRVLGQAQAKEWGISWIADDGMETFVNGNVNTMSCCWDSFWKLDKKDYGDKPVLLIIDEVESGLEHVTTGNTCKSKRAHVYKQLRRLAAHISATGGLILAADADLSSISLEYLQTIAHNPLTTIIDNQFKEKKKDLTLYSSKPGNVRVAIKDAVEFGGSFLFASDSKDELNVNYKWAVDYLKNSKLDDLVSKIWLFTSETIILEENANRLLDINAAIKKEKPIAVFYSPTLSVGTSIDVSHFMEAFGIFKGAVNVDQARQMIARYREFIPWTVFAENQSKLHLKSESSPTCEREIKQQLYRHLEFQDVVCSNIQDMMAVEQGRPIDEMDLLVYGQAFIKLHEMLSQEGYRSVDTAEYHLYASLKARENFIFQNYFEIMKRTLEAEGWNVQAKKGVETVQCQEIKDIKQKLQEEQSIQIAEADTAHIPTVDVAQVILQDSSDPALRNAAQKVVIADRCGLQVDQVDQEVVLKVKFDKQFFPAVLFQFKVENPVIAKLAADKKLKKAARDMADTGLPVLHDAADVAAKIEAIREFGLFDLLELDNPDKKYCKKDIVPLMDKIRLKYFNEKSRKNWCEKLGIPYNSEGRKSFYNNPIGHILKPILAKMGYTVKQTKRGKYDYFYQIPQEQIMDLTRDLIKDGLMSKHTQSETERAIRLALNPVDILEKQTKSNAA